MAEVIPFRGILYNTARISGGDVVAPPYDIITPELRAALYGKSPFNIVRIDSGIDREGDNKTENRYSRAARHLDDWLKEGILTRAPKPCFYAYEMEYRVAGELKRLHGFFGLVKLQDLGEGIYPHEETHSKPKVDRLNLMHACKANTSPIFSIYNSPDKGASAVIDRTVARPPYIAAKDLDGSVHRLWIIEDERDISAISRDLQGKAIFIADGHHRYETALEYQKEMREEPRTFGKDEPFDYVLMFLANIPDGNITILPAHRIIGYPQNVLERLSGHFDIGTMPLDDDIIKAMRGRVQTLGLYVRGERNQYLLSYRGDGLKETPLALKGLDVIILHELIFKNLLGVSKIVYEMDAANARQLAASGDYNMVFFLNPTRVEDVERVALSSLRMPPKSTYFYPKVMTGFVINSIKDSMQA